MLSLLCIPSFLCVSLFLYKAVSFLNNIRLAKATGLPYTFSLLHELEIWAFLTDPILRWNYAAYLMRGQGWPRWARFMVKDWMYEDKGRAHKEFGNVFLVVAPGGIVCYVADAASAMSVCSRRKDFIKPPEKMSMFEHSIDLYDAPSNEREMLEPFGPNVVSTEGSLWRFHIRVTLPPFGETVNKLVWAETFRQTEFLTAAWAANGSGDLKTDIYSLTVNVMSCVGFGQPADWTDAHAPPPGHSMSLVGAIYGVVAYLPHILLLPKWALKRSPWKKAYRSFVEYKSYMHEFLDTEKKRLISDSAYEGTAKGNLLTAVLKSSLSGKNAEKVEGVGERTTLTDEEILGNIFIFLLAGYDTTANTMIYSSIMLALYDDVQDQMTQEIDRVYKEAGEAGRTELSYTEDLPKFRYLLAFMYEIMRVYPIVIPIGRTTPTAQQLSVPSSPTLGKRQASTEHTLPAHCGVIVNNTAIHYNDCYWPHPHILEPRRWLSVQPNAFDPTSPQENPALGTNGSSPIPNHVKGTFLTFSEGPRACLGRRFAQVEFVAFFARLLKQYKITLRGGSMQKEEVEKMLRLRSGGSPVTLVPAVDVKLGLVPRGER